MATAIESRQEQLEELYFEVFGDVKQQSQKQAAESHHELPDDILIQKALQAKNGPEFKSLWNGSTSSYGGDDSRAGYGLCVYAGILDWRQCCPNGVNIFRSLASGSGEKGGSAGLQGEDHSEGNL